MTVNSGNQRFIDSLVLNNIQRDAVLYNEGPELVFAGAGTGKTRVLTAKIAYLIKEGGFAPYEIFAATFTNKAAREMRERIESMIEINCSSLWIGTFHSLCVRILRQEAEILGYHRDFTIYDSADQLSLIKKVMKELGLDDRSIQPRAVLHYISGYKNRCLTPREVEKTAQSFFDREIINAYSLYQKKLKESMAMDFDDLITNTVYLLKNSEIILEKYRNIFKYVLVDEYQDTNKSQFELIKLLAHTHQRLFVVGDDDQSIYSWRGAKVENILTFDQTFPKAKVFKLEQNYRSTKSILEFANSAIKENYNRELKRLWTTKSDDRDVFLIRYRDDRHEADSVAERILELMAKGVKPGKIAILFRTNAQSRVFEDSLRRKKINYVLVGGMSFYDRKEVKDCIAYLRLLVNPNDNISLERILNVPTRGIGAKSVEKLYATAAENRLSVFDLIKKQHFPTITGKAKKGLESFGKLYTSLCDLYSSKEAPQKILIEAIEQSGYLDILKSDPSEEARSRLENVNELVNAITVWHHDNSTKELPHFLEEISLVSDIDSLKSSNDAVSLMTLHSSKGLEYPAVFLVGLEDGILPSKQNLDDLTKLEEERRLFYVGSTRAMESLECSFVDSRMRFGSIMPMEKSRFIEPIAGSLYKYVDFSGKYTYKKTMVKEPIPSAPIQRRTISNIPTSNKSSIRRAQPQPKRTSAPDQDFEFSQETVQYRTGQQVIHQKYGNGKIVSISGFGADLQLTILFADGTRKKMLARFAKLDTY